MWFNIILAMVLTWIVIFTWKKTKNWRKKIIDGVSDSTLNLFASLPLCIIFTPLIMLSINPIWSLGFLFIQTCLLIVQIICLVLYIKRIRQQRTEVRKYIDKLIERNQI